MKAVVGSRNTYFFTVHSVIYHPSQGCPLWALQITTFFELIKEVLLYFCMLFWVGSDRNYELGSSESLNGVPRCRDGRTSM